MKIKLFLLALLLVSPVMAQERVYNVPDGFHHIVLVAHWAHVYRPPFQDPVPWSDTDDLYVTGPGTVNPDSSEGYPVGFEWYLDTQLVKYCDYNPILGRLFTDDFESGGLNKWAVVTGGDTAGHVHVPNFVTH